MSFLFDRNGRSIADVLADLGQALADVVFPISAVQIPADVHQTDPEDPGELVTFPSPDASPSDDPPGDPPSPAHPMVGDVLIPVPYLAGMDDVDIQRAHCTVATEADPFSFTAPKSGTAASTDVQPPGPAITGVLTQVVLHDLRPQVSGSDVLVVSGTDGYTTWELQDGELVASHQGSAPGGGAKYLHAVLQAPSGNGFGPPMVAAPYFAMPGNQAGLYGPALGGMSARSTIYEDGRVDVTLTLSPPVPVSAFRVTLGIGGDSAHAGLPNEMAPNGWSAAEVTGHWQRRPSGLTVLAVTGTGAGNEDGPATVATLGQELDERRRDIDFTPAARSLLRAHYPNAGPPELGFRLRLVASSAGKVRVRLDRIGARYLRRLGGADGDSISLTGAPETLTLAGVPAGLHPHGFSFTVDGRYGPAVLVAAADEPLPPATRTGYRLAGPVWMARRIPLTEAERGRRLLRVGLFCRAGADAEVLIGLHDGDELRVGSARGPTASIPVSPSAHPAWHRAELPLEAGLAPHPAALWVVAQVTRGVVWWYGGLDEEAPLLRSADAGGTWSAVSGRPGLQLHVEHVDDVTRQPLPDKPLRLLGPAEGSGQLSDDVAAIPLLGPPGEFRRHWVINRASDSQDTLANFGTLAGGTAVLAFSCRRDVELSVRDVVLTYDPWAATTG
ncbi:hypothetical protein [Haliangium sp.]|uniref:hypothetical protein n=1 Tax=Haliangium sp. TaxID=2663208 RepID=UPI003D1193A0